MPENLEQRREKGLWKRDDLVFLGANRPTLECESSRERKFPGQFAPGNESSRERKGQGTKVPRSESSRERIGQGPIGRFAPGSELAREQKGCESFYVGLVYVVSLALQSA